MPRLSTKNTVVKIEVMRVSRSPAPRAVNMPEGPPPMPSAPPSERCIRITAVSATQSRTRITRRIFSSMMLGEMGSGQPGRQTAGLYHLWTLEQSARMPRPPGSPCMGLKGR